MKFHKKIAIEGGHAGDQIYDQDVAREVYLDEGEWTAKEFSQMKQENIRCAIDEGASVDNLSSTIAEKCGYCFEFYDGGNCSSCPLNDDNLGKCFTRNQFFKLESWDTDLNIEEWAQLHKEWCIELGLWKKEWK